MGGWVGGWVGEKRVGGREGDAWWHHWGCWAHARVPVVEFFCLLPFTPCLQAALRGKVGEEATAFERISDGARTISRGEVVHVNAKPQMVGRVLHFSIPQVRQWVTGRLAWVAAVSMQCVSKRAESLSQQAE